ncbi:ferritin-like domain-containing protein [Herbaspirillum sp. alder98]|uniref:YciE/YciF ferroxidase family protein n=1 Tax=Herbaspirillum sp. alder98 TaxID=2913096 RepID=UPI001CD8953F|nr:ferritin-like domain-containing protein [Herbaspirillum sp. alder98]MCA1324773.1 ferritin-like domain-containing protein [Herbaspirillum sp. alder98]
MTIKSIEDLFVHSLSDISNAEKQLTKALPRLLRAASEPELKAAFEANLDATQGRIERIDQAVEETGLRLRRVKCAAMEGLVEEGKEQIEEVEKGAVLDSALIAAAQKIAHYEIATYGTLCALAKHLDYSEASKQLHVSLEESKAIDAELTILAQRGSSGKQMNARSVGG